MFITIIIRCVWWPKKHRFRVVAVDHFIFLVSLLFLIRLYFLKRYTSLLRRMYYYIVYPILLSTEKKKLLKKTQTMGGKLSNYELRLLYC